VGNRACGERLAALVPPAVARLAASIMLLSPHLPLLFMGEEYGETNPFLFFCSFGDRELIENVRHGRRRDYSLVGEVPDPNSEATFQASKLSWTWPEGTFRSGLRQLYGDLLAARRTWPALRDFEHRQARLLPEAAAGPRLLELARGQGDDRVLIYFNLSDQPQPLEAPPGVNVVFRSEAEKYTHETSAEKEGVVRPWECVVWGSRFASIGTRSVGA
jgi:maltooligosyltrehalose trehalohydrolase